MTVLLREAIGDRLRHARTTKRRTLRDISRAARVSLGYLSEVERGQKEASSELLASICEALDLELSDLLHNVASDVCALDSVDAAGVDHGAGAEVDAPAREVADAGGGGFEGGRLVPGSVGNDLNEFRLSPALRTTIPAPESKAVLAA